MKVAILRNSFGPSNAQIMRVATALQELGHDLVFVTRQHEKSSQTVDNHKFRVEELYINGISYPNYEIQLPATRGGGIKNILPTTEFLFCLNNILNKLAPELDAIHAIDLDTGYVARKIAEKYQLKFVYHIADFYSDSRLGLPDILRSFLRKKEFEIINNADSTIICTEKRREQISGSNPNSLRIIHNAPPIKRKKSDYPKDNINFPIKISYVGSINKERFIPQAAQVISKFPEFEFYLAGFIDETHERFIDRINHLKNIHILGPLPYDQAFEQYRSADIMFALYDPNHPNHKYSAPNKIYEAMLLGLPIIVARNTGMDEIVMEEDMGFVIPYDMSSFEDTLTKIIEQPEILFSKAVNAYNAYEKYSWKKMKKRIQDIYLTLC